MKRIAFIVMLLAAVFTSAGAQLLYKVSGGNLSKPSYIVGTYHLAPASFVAPSPVFAVPWNRLSRCVENLK